MYLSYRKPCTVCVVLDYDGTKDLHKYSKNLVSNLVKPHQMYGFDRHLMVDIMSTFQSM